MEFKLCIGSCFEASQQCSLLAREMAYVSRSRKPQVASPGKQTTEVSLDDLRADLLEIKDELKKTVKEDTLENLVTSIIKKILQQNNKELGKLIDEKVEKRCKQIEEKYEKKLDNMTRNIDILEKKAETLTEKLLECKIELREYKENLTETQEAAVEALRRSNHNEQYSRKYNFKIMNLKETEKENTREKVKTFIKENAGVALNDQEIVAAHRIPGEKGKGRPILVKVINTDVKSRVMRKRSAVKDNGFRLVDDVTKANVSLIKRLSEHQNIESAWYFNGSVYGKVGDKRMKFDITDDIDNKVKKAAR